MRKRPLQLMADEKLLRQFAQQAEAYFVVDQVANDSAIHAVPSFRKKFVAMVEALEGSLLLHIGEMMIPFEFSDQRNPLRTNGKEGKHAKRRYNFGADASQGVAISDRRLCCGNARRWYEVQLDQFGSGLWRHDPREIAGIGEEEEDTLNRNRHPLLELNVVHHPVQINLTESRRYTQ